MVGGVRCEVWSAKREVVRGLYSNLEIMKREGWIWGGGTTAGENLKYA